MGFLDDLTQTFGNWRTGVSTALARTMAPVDRGTAVVKRPGDDRPLLPSTNEKIAATIGVGGVAGRVQFLPYLDSTTGDTPAVRQAMRAMLLDPNVKSAWFAQVMAVASEEFQVQPFDDGDPASQEQADFIRDGIDRLPLGSAGLLWSLTAPLGPDGVSVVEPVTELETRGRWAGKWVPQFAKAKDVQYLYLMGDRYRNVTAVRSLRTPNLGDVDAADLLITRYGALFEEAFGFAPFRSSLSEFWLLDTVRKLRAIHHEKRSSGTLLGTYQLPSQQKTLERVLSLLGLSTWATVPPGVKIDALQLTQATDTDYAKFEADKVSAVVRGIAFAELQMLTGDVPDGRGNSQVHQATSDLPKWYLSKLATETINRQWIPRYTDYNFAGVKGYSRFSLGGINAADILQEMDQVTKAQAVGFNGQGQNPALSVKHYAKTLGLQLADPNDPADRLVLGPPPPPPGSPTVFPQGGGNNPFAQMFAELNDRVTVLTEEVRKKG